MNPRCAISLIAALGLASCAGRSANPVAVVQPYDGQLSCVQLMAETQTNEIRVQGLVGEKDSANDGNVAIGIVGGLLFWPALFALDLSDAEKVEMEALRARNTHLAGVMTRKGCFDREPEEEKVQTEVRPADDVAEMPVPASAVPSDE